VGAKPRDLHFDTLNGTLWMEWRRPHHGGTDGLKRLADLHGIEEAPMVAGNFPVRGQLGPGCHINVFNSSWQPTTLSQIHRPEACRQVSSPSTSRNSGGKLYVTYASLGTGWNSYARWRRECSRSKWQLHQAASQTGGPTLRALGEFVLAPSKSARFSKRFPHRQLRQRRDLDYWDATSDLFLGNPSRHKTASLWSNDHLCGHSRPAPSERFRPQRRIFSAGNQK